MACNYISSALPTYVSSGWDYANKMVITALREIRHINDRDYDVAQHTKESKSLCGLRHTRHYAIRTSEATFRQYQLCVTADIVNLVLKI